MFDQAKGLVTLLLSNHVAQNSPQPTDVFNQGLFLGGQGLGGAQAFKWLRHKTRPFQGETIGSHMLAFAAKKPFSKALF
jgi:hypothetical protein